MPKNAAAPTPWARTFKNDPRAMAPSVGLPLTFNQVHTPAARNSSTNWMATTKNLGMVKAKVAPKMVFNNTGWVPRQVGHMKNAAKNAVQTTTWTPHHPLRAASHQG